MPFHIFCACLHLPSLLNFSKNQLILAYSILIAGVVLAMTGLLLYKRFGHVNVDPRLLYLLWLKDNYRMRLNLLLAAFAGCVFSWLPGIAADLIVQASSVKQTLVLQSAQVVCLSDSQTRDQGKSVKVRVLSWGDRAGRKFVAPFEATLFTKGKLDLAWGQELSLDNASFFASTNQPERRSDFRIFAEDLKIEAPQPIWDLRHAILQWIKSGLSRLNSETRGLAEAFLFGNQDQVSDRMKNAFFGTGCAHLLALSGMHVALLAGFLNLVFRPIVGRRASALLSLLLCSFFVFLVGAFPSAIRALLMFALLSISRFFSLKINSLTSLALSSLVVCTFYPDLATSLGFQLSSLALWGILFWQADIGRALRRPLGPVLASWLGPSLAAQTFTIPLLVRTGLPWIPQGMVIGLLLGPLSLIFMALALLELLITLSGLPFLALLSGPISFLLDGLCQIMYGLGSPFVAASYVTKISW